MQLVLALVITVFALSRNLWLSHLVLFLGSLWLIALFASINSLVQLQTTDEMRGRVTSIFMLAFRGGMPLGNLAAGALASLLSPPLALVAISALLGLSALSFLDPETE